MPRHPTELKIRITTLREVGKSWGEIQQITGVSKSTARSIVSKAKQEGTVENRKGCGRPPKINNRDKRMLTRNVSRNRRLSLEAVTAQFNVSRQNGNSVSCRTVRRLLNRSGWARRCAAVVPAINRRNRLKRLQFCSSMSEFPWHRLVFSDEVRFGLQSDGRVYVWRQKGQRYDPACVVQRSSCRKSVMFWGCISYDGAGLLIPCSDKMNSKEYVRVLDAAGLQLLPASNLIFQDDNAPIHRSEMVEAWLRDNQIERIDWPPNSPDLSIIENIWAILKKRLIATSLTCSFSISSLQVAVQNEWKNITKETIQRLYRTMPQRLAECKKLKGYATRF